MQHSPEQQLEWMERAIELAKMAEAEDEVPVGALVVGPDGKIVSEAYNQRETKNSPTAHAEILAIEKAAKVLGNWRLSGHTVVVTLEPCLMCSGALSLARVESCIFGAFDQRFGALHSLYRIHEDKRLNHRFEAQGGVLEEKCRKLLVDFFKQKR